MSNKFDDINYCCELLYKYVYDEKLRRDFWDDKWYFFFKDGPSDTEYCLIKFVPKKIEFLDVKKRKCVNF